MHAEDESPIQETKLCTACGCEKPIFEFRLITDKRCLTSQRRHSWCKQCVNLTEQARRDRLRKQKPATIRSQERTKARRYREQNRERFNEYHRKYRQLQKRKAFERVLGAGGAGR